jgi:hypothetical protein
MIVAQYNVGKRKHSNLVQGQGDARGPLSARWRLVQDESKFLFQSANCFERRMRCLDIRWTGPRRHKTKIGGLNRISDEIVVAARRVNKCQRAAPLLKCSQCMLKLESIGDSFDHRFGVRSACRPIRDCALAIGLQHEHALVIFDSGDCQTDTES